MDRENTDRSLPQKSVEEIDGILQKALENVYAVKAQDEDYKEHEDEPIDSGGAGEDDMREYLDDDIPESVDDDSRESVDDDSSFDAEIKALENLYAVKAQDEDYNQHEDEPIDCEGAGEDDMRQYLDLDRLEYLDLDRLESLDDNSRESVDDDSSFDEDSELNQFLDYLDQELVDCFYNWAHINRWVEKTTQEPNTLYNPELDEPVTPSTCSNCPDGSDSSGNMTSDTYRGVSLDRRETPEGGRISLTGVKIFGTGIAYFRGYPLQYNYENTSPYPVELNGTTYYNTELQERRLNLHFAPYQSVNPYNYHGFQLPNGPFQGNLLNFKNCFCPFNCACAGIPMPPTNFAGLGVYPRPPLPPVDLYQASTNVPVVTQYDPHFNYQSQSNGQLPIGNFGNSAPLPPFGQEPGN